MYEYQAKVLRVIDGDTLKVRIDLGFFIHFDRTLRLFGINTPEMRGPDRDAGRLARDHVKRLLKGSKNLIRIQTIKGKRTGLERRGKYGRWLASVFYRQGAGGEWIDLNRQLVLAGMAKEYLK